LAAIGESGFRPIFLCTPKKGFSRTESSRDHLRSSSNNLAKCKSRIITRADKSSQHLLTIISTNNSRQQEEKMQAIVYSKYGDSSVLRVEKIDKPKVADHEVLIKTAYASVNPVDFKIRAGYMDFWPHEETIIPGWDVSGTVVSAPPGSGFQEGESVFSYTRPAFDMPDAHPTAAGEKIDVHTGTYAEYVSVPVWKVAKIPTTATLEQAAGVPLAALTAYQAIVDHLKANAGERLLILGASGGVGGYAVGIAKSLGLTVIGTCSARNIDYVKNLGADKVLDYNAGGLTEQLKDAPVDLIFDCVGGETVVEALGAIKKGGKVVSVADFAIGEKTPVVGCTGSAFLVQPSAEQLTTLAKLIDDGAVKLPKMTTFALADAAKAHELSESNRTVGKIVLKA
jgi:NADPH:quinone reductase-like Zn-dependent oxidoreductase